MKYSTVDKLDPAVSAARAAGAEVEFSGAVYPKPGRSDSPELIGLLVALVILVLTFGSLVAVGLPIVTAMSGVIVSLMGMTAVALTGDPIIKSIGFSFAIGVLIDAFVVRLTLVPAVMAIIGAKIWYHPRWYGRNVPDPDIEGERLNQRLAENDQLACV